MKIPYTTNTPDPEVAIALEVGKKFNVDEAMLIYTSKIEVRHWVVMKCKYGCDNYGKSYTCPPNSILPEEMQKILGEYKRAILVASKTKGVEDQERMRDALLEMEKALFLKNYYKAFALVPGCCTKCDTCKAKKGDSCLNNAKRPCIEGTGIDMFNLVRKYKKSMAVITDKDKEFESYGIILLD